MDGGGRGARGLALGAREGGVVRPRACLVGGPGRCRACAAREEAGAVLSGPGVTVGRCWALLTAVERAGGRREVTRRAGRWWLRCELAGRSRRPNKAAAGRSLPKRERAVM